MNLLKKLTIKNLKLNKKRTIVTIIGIILSVALITAVSSMYTSGIESLINFEKQEQGNYHAAYYDVPDTDLYIFKSNRQIKSLYITKNIGYAYINSKNEYKPYVYIKSFTKDALENLSVKLIKGSLPQNENEILIPSHLKTNGRVDLKIGDTLSLLVGERINYVDNTILDQSNPYLETENIINQEPKTYKIVGIIERPASNIENYSAPGYTLITYMKDEKITGTLDVYASYTSDGAKNAYKLTADILGVDASLFEKYYKATATNDEITKYIQNYSQKEKYKISINDYLITLETNPLGISSTGGLSIVVLVVIIVIIITSVFCIKNSFDISITEKTKQYGMLKSIGATKKQIKKNVLYEGTILGLIGIPIGVLMGLIASYLLIIISNAFLKNMLDQSITLIFKISTFSIVLSVILGIITIYLSSFRSAHKASKISPIDLIKNSANINLKSKKISSPKIIGKTFGIGGLIAYKNLKRNKKKYRTTTLSIIISVITFIALSSFMEMVFKELDNELKISDYNILLSSTSIEEENINKFIETTKLDNIENYTILKTIGFHYNNRKLNPEYIKFLHMNIKEDESRQEYLKIYALGEEQYKKYIKSLNLDYDEVKDKGIMMDYVTVGYQGNNSKMEYKTLKYTNYKKGDTLSGNLDDGTPYEIEITEFTDKKPFGLKNYQNTYIIISDELYNKIALNENKKEISIFYKSTNASKLQDNIEELLKEESFSLENKEENVKMMSNLYTLIGIFLYGFIIVISLIGITNIFNTITTNMKLRSIEFAMLKSIGMTKHEFNKMIRLESIFMGIKSLIIGVPIGTILSFIIYILFNVPFKYNPPILSIIIVSLVVILLITLIMKYSINKINKQNIIETIRNENI